MDTDRLLAYFRQDGPRLAAAAEGNLDAAVPRCPGWTVRDVVMHLAAVYRHKVAAIRENRRPDPWPPDFGEVEPLTHFRDSYQALLDEFAAHSPDDPAWVWDAVEDRTVRFWIRRMAQETAVHRVDVEEAAGAVTPVDPELAVDGVDEVLAMMLPSIQASWPEAFTDVLKDAPVEVVAVRTGGREWSVGLGPSGVTVGGGEVAGTASGEAARTGGAGTGGGGEVAGTAGGEAAATVSGDPGQVLLWLWGRAGSADHPAGDRADHPAGGSAGHPADGSADDPVDGRAGTAGVRFDGDRGAVARLRAVLVEATQ